MASYPLQAYIYTCDVLPWKTATWTTTVVWVRNQRRRAAQVRLFSMRLRTITHERERV